MSLFDPITLRCGLTLPNRVVLAPMTNQQSQPDGLLGDDEYHWLARRADGGYGLLETCAAYVGLDGKAWPGELGIDRDACLPGLTKLAKRLTTPDCKPMVQLFHGGVRATQALTGEQVWSASTWHEDGPTFETPRVATTDDLARVIEQFAAAAARAEQAGFAGVELHGAHGYLLCQFLSRTMNPRSDGWGGDLAGRARLIREVARAIRARVSKSFAVGARLSLEDWGQARGMDLDDSLQVANWLVDDGCDFIHVSLWNVDKMSAKRPDEHPITATRAALPRDIPVIACGSMWSRADADAAMARGADLIALGRAAILNPEWPTAARDPAWQPRRPPMSRAELVERAVSPQLVGYLTRWKNLVSD
jgi:2,4-dienoyl-CoA reductase-like NADH-dependent reductase (Old Yellow Enzyme family)|nr:NADH:flavin oxidoreductase [Kofleriaceae bacterium]